MKEQARQLLIGIEQAEVLPMRPSAVSYVVQILPASRAPLRWQDLTGRFWRKLLYPYRPELYYMRGPGPKWREKHLHNAAR